MVQLVFVFSYQNQLLKVHKHYSFTPVAIESLGAMGKRSLTFVKELGHRVRQCSGEVKARAYLLQRLSVAVQRGNAVSVLGTVKGRSGLDLFCG